MLCEIYIEALLVYEDVADQVQAALMAGEIDDSTALVAWWLVGQGVKCTVAAIPAPE